MIIYPQKIRTDISVFNSVAPKPLATSIPHLKKRKLCPFPVLTFIGRKDILDQMSKYFASNCGSRHIFVLHGLGGSGKSQLAYKFLEDSQAGGDKWYVIESPNYNCSLFTILILSFSDIFYIDATNEHTLQADLGAIVPGSAEQSVDASLQWLAHQHDRRWLIFFDNADDPGLDLGKFIPRTASGNTLITTRNQGVRLLAGVNASAQVAGMSSDDSTQLLLQLSCIEWNEGNQMLAEKIVKVCTFILIVEK